MYFFFIFVDYNVFHFSFEGELLEVGLDEVQQIWAILQIQRPMLKEMCNVMVINYSFFRPTLRFFKLTFVCPFVCYQFNQLFPPSDIQIECPAVLLVHCINVFNVCFDRSIQNADYRRKLIKERKKQRKRQLEEAKAAQQAAQLAAKQAALAKEAAKTAALTASKSSVPSKKIKLEEVLLLACVFYSMLFITLRLIFS